MSFRKVDQQTFKELMISFGITSLMSSKTAKIIPVGIYLTTLRAFETGKNVENTVAELITENPILLQQDMSIWANEAKEVNKPKKNK